MLRILLFLICTSIWASNGTKTPKTTEPTLFGSLPIDIKKEIAQYLDLPDIKNISLINKDYYMIANIMWQQKFKDILGNFNLGKDEEVYLTDKDNKLIKDEEGNNIINWMLTFEKNLKKVINDNLIYLKEHKKLGDSERDKVLAFAKLETNGLIPDGADLTKANLMGATLDDLFLDNISFTDANLSKTNITKTQFNLCNFERAKFNSALIDNTFFDDSIMENTHFIEAKIKNTKFVSQFDIINTNFSLAEISKSDFDLVMKNINFTSAILAQVIFAKDASLININFSSAILYGVIFKSALKDINFNLTDLRSVTFIKTKLE